MSVMTRTITRRRFLKATGALAAVVALSSAVKWHAEASSPQPEEDVWVPTVCLNCGTHAKCALLAHRVNGTVTRIKGNPASPSNMGRICAKSQAMISELYNLYRIRFPVKRTNPIKGPNVDPGWMEISWDEALNTVASQVQAVIKDDPRKLVIMQGHLDTNLLSYFVEACGTPNRVMGGTSSFCGGGSSPVNAWVYGAAHTYPDMSRSKYVINLGAQPIQGAKGTPPQIHDFVAGRENGLQVVNVAPSVTPSTAKSSRWVPIVPGTAIPFVMSLTNVLVNELEVYDEPFLKNHTNAAYLIGSDGHYVRAAQPLVDDPVRKKKLGKPLVWDTVDNIAKPFDDPGLKDLALTGTYTVEGSTAKPAFQLVKEHVAQYPPEKTAATTGIPADALRQIAQEFAKNARIGETTVIDGLEMPYRPVAIVVESGGKGHLDNNAIVQACALPCTLVGAVGVPGSMNAHDPISFEFNPADGMPIPGLTFKPIPKASEHIGLTDLFPFGGAPGIWFDVVVHPEKHKFPYEPTVLGFQGGNPQQLGADRDLVDQTFQKFKFIFAISLVFDEPTQMADVVLPENSWLERHGVEPALPYRGYTMHAYQEMGTGNVLRQPVVEKPVFDTREGDDIVLELARRIGIAEGPDGIYDRINKGYKLAQQFQVPLQGSTITWPEIVDRILKNAHGPSKGLDWFTQHGLDLNKKMGPDGFFGYAKYRNLRVPIYFEEFVGWREELASELSVLDMPLYWPNDYVLWSYRPLPDFRPHPEHRADPKVFPFYAINWKNMQLFYGDNDVPWTIELTERFDPYSMHVMINRDVAKTLGLKDNDLVRLTSMGGNSIEGTIVTTALVAPNVLGIPGAYGARSTDIHPWARIGPNFNALWKLDESYMDPETNRLDLTTRVSIERVV
jgi:anaerobic selenocysteine-containing dehydrogenase